jgi:hypothetical protein
LQHLFIDIVTTRLIEGGEPRILGEPPTVGIWLEIITLGYLATVLEPTVVKYCFAQKTTTLYTRPPTL